jgi:hypothetical protein
LYSRKPNHSEYLDSVIGFETEINKLYVINVDHKKYLVSWNKCCSGKDGDSISKLKKACR